MVPKFVDECLSKDAQKRITVFEAQHGHLAPGTATSFLKLWSAIGKSETIHALDLDRKVQTNFSARFLNETGCSYFKVACNSTSIASLLVPGDPSSADLRATTLRIQFDGNSWLIIFFEQTNLNFVRITDYDCTATQLSCARKDNTAF